MLLEPLHGAHHHAFLLGATKFQTHCALDTLPEMTFLCFGKGDLKLVQGDPALDLFNVEGLVDYF